MAVATIDVTGLGKAYRAGRAAPTWVLQDVDLRVAEGTILGLLGPNGAGKTTLIKILAGLLWPDRGGGMVLGVDLLRRPAAIRAQVSLVAPTVDVGLDNNLTVLQNLAFWAPIYGLRGPAARARIVDLLDQLGLSEKADSWPMHISAGQRQRLALARALLARNPLVFLDEPTNKLDLEGVHAVRSMIAALNTRYGVTVVLTTHVMEEAEELCGEIALLRAGRLVAHQPATEWTHSLGLTRPITLTVRPAIATGTQPPVGWQAGLAQLPGVVAVAAPIPAEAPESVTCVAHSTDLRATMPALVRWVRAGGLALVSVQAAPVTLTDVFRALAGDPAALPGGIVEGAPR
jgi:ABC-2 type transport system ATP-binding protein